MKKYILASLIVSLGASVVVGLCPNVVVAESKSMTYLTGYVFPPRDDPYDVAGLKVSVSCLDYVTGQNYGDGSDIVDSSGSFLVILPREKCPPGSRILGGAGDDEGLHYGHGRNFGDSVINSKLTLYQGDIGMLW